MILQSWTEDKKYLTNEEENFILPLLEQSWFDFILQEAVDRAHLVKTASQKVMIKGLKEAWIDVNQSEYEYVDYIVLLSLVWWWFASSKLPLPIHFKILVSWSFYWYWATYFVWVLKERGVLDKMINDQSLPENIRGSLKNLKKIYG